MQDAPPVPELLARLARFANDVERELSGPDVVWYARPSTPTETALPPPAGHEWSLTEILCHLRDVEREIHQERFRALIAQDNAFIPGATPDDWAERRGYWCQSGSAALADFLAARQQTLTMLRGLDEKIWQRRGRHAFLGLTSMHELLYLVANHDQAHWEQIQALL